MNRSSLPRLEGDGTRSRRQAQSTTNANSDSSFCSHRWKTLRRSNRYASRIPLPVAETDHCPCYSAGRTGSLGIPTTHLHSHLCARNHPHTRRKSKNRSFSSLMKCYKRHMPNMLRYRGRVGVTASAGTLADSVKSHWLMYCCYFRPKNSPANSDSRTNNYRHPCYYR
jgi:hypothetical protein